MSLEKIRDLLELSYKMGWERIKYACDDGSMFIDDTMNT